MTADAFGVDRTGISKANPLTVGRKAAQATKVGVGPGGTPTQRAAAHTGIAAGHAMTAGGVAMAGAGAAGGYALAKRPGQRPKRPVGKPMPQPVVKAATTDEVRSRNRKRTQAVLGATGAGAAASAGLVGAGGVDIARAARTYKKADLAFNFGADAKNQGLDYAARHYKGAGYHLASRAARQSTRGMKNAKRGVIVGGATLAAGLPAIAATSRKNRKDWQKVAKSNWKTIEQRERAQGRNRKNAREIASWGGLATGTGLAMAGLGTKTQSDLARMADNTRRGYRFRNSANASLRGVGVAPMKGSKASDAIRAVKAGASTPKAGAGKTALGLMAGGIAVGAAAHGVAGSRNKYHQHKINERRRANEKRSKTVAKSAFGVEHGAPISKGVVADWKKESRESKEFGRVGYTGKKGERKAAVRRIGQHQRMVRPGPDRKENWKTWGEHTAKGTAAGTALGAGIGAALAPKGYRKPAAAYGAILGAQGGAYAGSASGTAIVSGRAARRGFNESIKAGEGVRRTKKGEKVNWKGRIVPEKKK